MVKRLFIPIFMLGLVGTLLATKKTQKQALVEIHNFIEETAKNQGLILDQLTRIHLQERSKVELIRRQDKRGFVENADIDFIKNQFTAFAQTLAVDNETISYYQTIKQLKHNTLLAYEKIAPKATYSAKQALWLKIKKQSLDKEIRNKAFIAKNNELVVKRVDLERLSTVAIDRVKDLAKNHNKKADRMISFGYAESKVRDLLRKSGFRNTEHVKIIMEDIKKSLKEITTGTRIALSKLEHTTVSAMKRFKKQNKDPEVISRLAAETKILKAIKNAQLTSTQQIAATNEMADALSRRTSRDTLTKSFVDEVIHKIIKRAQEKKQKSKKITHKKKSTKRAKTQKRGKNEKPKRWGNPRKPAE
ncbi:hypothetical protein FJ364_00955 [Candidatus Dependentiae bacterium]|nr:hypothetical protein [Candidatus Dependentiae bacterium]